MIMCDNFEFTLSKIAHFSKAVSALNESTIVID